MEEETIRQNNKSEIVAFLLEVDSDLKPIKSYELRKNSVITIGRTKDNDIFSNHSEVSRKHCIILEKNNIFYIKDDSKFGSELNGVEFKKVAKRLLDRDKIKIKDITLTFYILSL